MLRKLMEGDATGIQFNEMLGREVLLAFHFWIMDYRSDGHHRGFPFDPYTLYLHRRLMRASRAIDDLLSRPAVARQSRPVLFSFQEELQRYRDDPEIAVAAEGYERAFAMFSRLRSALRLKTDAIEDPHRAYELPSGQQDAIKMALTRFNCELRQQSEDENDPDRPLARIVLAHLGKYWNRLLPDQSQNPVQRWHRTTSALEKDWRNLKRPRRQAHGRSSLTLDFLALPEEHILVLNLQNPSYLDLMMGGSLDALPSRLAAASRDAGPFYKWQRLRHPRFLGQPPQSWLHDEQFIDNLVEACDTHCEHQDRHDRAAA
jgi:hypothetical protein